MAKKKINVILSLSANRGMLLTRVMRRRRKKSRRKARRKHRKSRKK